MRELNARHRAMPTDGVSHECMRRKATRSHQIKMEHMACISLRMHDKLADCNRGCTSLCTQFIKSLCTWTRIAIRSDVSRTHRRREDPVTEIQITKLYRTCKVRVLIGYHI